MIFSDLFNRNARRSLLIEINPYQILAAVVDRPDEGPVVLDSAAEFASEDDAGLRAWLESNFERQKSWVPVTAGFVSPEGLLQRESLLPRRLVEPGYLADFVQEQFKVENPTAWKLAALSPLEGSALLPEGTQRPALICGISHTEVRQVQQRLLDHRLLPYRLEQSILPLLGAISDYKTRRNDKRAIVVVNIGQEHTVAYVLGKEGVHTHAPVRHGFAAIVQAARKEFGLADADAVRERLQHADEELLLRATKFVRAIGRDLKPLVDSYEMTTGQPVGEIYCAYLPPALGWIAEPLAQVVGRTLFAMDCAEWLPSVNLRAADGVAPFGLHWLGALSLVAELPGPKPESTPREDAAYQGPWHLDCRLSAQLPNSNLIRRRFLTNVVVTTLAAAAIVATFWQLYVGHSLNTDTAFWMQRIADNRKQVDTLNQTVRALGNQTARFDAAYDLMGAPYRVSDLILKLGQPRPAALRIDTIESFESGLVMRGGLNEPSDRASRTLRQYVEDLRRDPLISATFVTITLTSLTRQEATESFAFELTFKMKSAQP